MTNSHQPRLHSMAPPATPSRPSHRAGAAPRSDRENRSAGAQGSAVGGQPSPIAIDALSGGGVSIPDRLRESAANREASRWEMEGRMEGPARGRDMTTGVILAERAQAGPC